VDQHGAFEGVFSAYCAEHDVVIDVIEAYNAKKNAKGERPHKPIMDRIRAVCPRGRYDLWHTVLPTVMEAVNTAYNRNLGTSAFHVLRGYDPMTRLTVRSTVPSELAGVTPEQWLACIRAVHERLELRNLVTSYVQREDHRQRHAHTVPKFSADDSVFLFFPTRPTKLHSYFRPGYVVVREDGTDYYLVAKRQPGGKLGTPQRVPVSRLRPFDASRTPDGGASLGYDLKPDHLVVESIATHYLDDAGKYYFYPKYAGLELSPDDPPAVLGDLTRNCKSTLVEYLKRHGIPFACIDRQRKAEASAASRATSASA